MRTPWDQRHERQVLEHLAAQRRTAGAAVPARWWSPCCTLRCGTSAAGARGRCRSTRAWSSGGANPASEFIASLASASWDAFRAAICSRDGVEPLDRIRRSTPAGRRTSPPPGCSACRSPTARTRRAPASGAQHVLRRRSPRSHSRSRNAPAIAVSTTSLTVPPRPCRIALSSSRRRPGHGPPAVRSDRARRSRAAASAAGPRPRASAPRDGVTHRAQRLARRRAPGPGRHAAARPASAASRSRHRRRAPRRSVPAPVSQLSAGRGGPVLGARVEQQDIRSVPETPSTMQWWTLEIKAHRPSVEPLDHPQLPQRPVAVELHGHQPAHQVVAAPPRRRAAAAPCGARGRRG